ncbi:MAG: hypothetical protein JXA33_01110 [Anaerolineae bacterium]|nr:hypothetical protein [Anaerolineae bacterium]
MVTVSNQDKAAIWKAFNAGHPVRVPVTLITNPRIILLDPRLNPKGITFEQYFVDPATMVEVQLQHALYRAQVINRYCDEPAGLPEYWTVYVDYQNTYEAAFFGAEIIYRPGQVPDVRPPYTGERREAIFDIDIDRPLSQGIFRQGLETYARMVELTDKMTFKDRPVKITPYFVGGTDGPVTVAMNVRGTEFMTDLALNPDYAQRLMAWITGAAITRVRAFRAYWDQPDVGGGLADDSIQLISARMYREMVLPHHRRYLDALCPGQARGIHLCGDATRHFKTIHDALNVWDFDTGFPVNFSRLRQELGPDTTIRGGVEVTLLLHGTPEAVYARTKDILQSGIKQGGKFILREANNLPPRVPEGNLAAMYQACLDYGNYEA